MPFTNEELAYSAGIIDGEGYIGITKHSERRRKKNTFYYTIMVKVGMTDKEAVDFLYKLFGGYLYLEKRKDVKDVWIWSIVGIKKVAPILRLLLPYLKVKNTQADILLTYCSCREWAKNNLPTRGKGTTNYSDIETILYKLLRFHNS
jgi:hypothetical protein